MAPIYRIAKWKETFEKSDAKRLVSLPWISVPTDLDSNGFMAMAEDFDDDAPAIYGAWVALCAFAAGCNERGTLATSQGHPIPLSRVAKRTGWPLSVFERLVEWATTERINWIDVTGSPAALPATNGAIPCDPGEIPDHKTDGQDKTEQNGRTDGAREDRPVAVRPILFEGNWGEIQVKSVALHSSIDKDRGKLKAIDKTLCLNFAAIQFGYPELSEHLDKICATIRERVRSNTLDRPWGWLKSELIRVCNTYGAGYDAMIAAIDMRRSVPISN